MAQTYGVEEKESTVPSVSNPTRTKPTMGRTTEFMKLGRIGRPLQLTDAMPVPVSAFRGTASDIFINRTSEAA